MTDEELVLVGLLGRVYRTFERVCADGATRDDDLMEARLLVHGLQNMVCRNAAARAYPGRIRRLGATFGDATPPAAAGEPTTTLPPSHSDEPQR